MITVDWRQLGGSDTDHTALAVDFGAGRHEAGFGELAANLDVDCLFLESVPKPVEADGTEDGVVRDPGAVVRRWCADIVDCGLSVDAVLGFCAGASLACALADCAAEYTGHQPTVILLDPLVVRPPMLAQRFREAVDAAASAGPGAVIGALGAVQAAVDSGSGALAGVVKAAHRSVIASACANDDLGPDLVDQLTGHFASLIDYLALAMSLDAAAVWAPGVTRATTVLASAGFRHESPLPRIDKTFDVSRMDFLADAQVAKTVSELIGSARSV